MHVSARGQAIGLLHQLYWHPCGSNVSVFATKACVVQVLR